MAVSSVLSAPSARIELIGTLRARFQAQADAAQFAVPEPGRGNDGWKVPVPVFELPAWLFDTFDSLTAPLTAKASPASAHQRFSQAAQAYTGPQTAPLYA